MNKQRSGALHLTQKVDYGITLLIELARSEERRSIKQIAEEKDLSFTFLQKIARNLQKSGLIKAERGKYGGYKLQKAPSRLALKEIIEALEGPIAILPCLKACGDKPCNRTETCDVKKGLHQINEDILSYFAKKTLDQLI